MAKVVTDDKYYKDIANIIRSYDYRDVGEYKLFPYQIRGAIEEVIEYYAYLRFEEGDELAKQAFWEEFQKRGKRTDYYCGFAGYGWHDGTFYPRYDIKPSNATQMFWYFGQMESISMGSTYVDLVERLDECGVRLDFSGCVKFTNAFAYARFTRVGVIDTTGASDLTKIFAYAGMTTIDELRLSPEGGQTFTNAFLNAKNLTNVTITGMITNTIDLSQCRKLSRASICSFVSALSTASKGRTITFSATALDNAGFYESNEDGSESLFGDLMDTRPSWTFNVV